MTAGLAPVEFAPAKVNLYLHVVGRRADGYHLLDSLVVFPTVGRRGRPRSGRLRVRPVAAHRRGLRGGDRGRAGQPRAPRGRGCWPTAPAPGPTRRSRWRRTCRSLRASAAARATPPPPCACCRGAGRCRSPPSWPLAALGADVPVCLEARPRRMGGVGERLSDVPAVPACGLVLVNPGVAVSTPAVFKARAPGFLRRRPRSPRVGPTPPPWRDWLEPLGNDLQAPAIALCPVIADVLSALRGTAGLPARPHERVRRHLLRLVRDAHPGPARGGHPCRNGMVDLGRGARWRADRSPAGGRAARWRAKRASGGIAKPGGGSLNHACVWGVAKR